MLRSKADRTDVALCVRPQSGALFCLCLCSPGLKDCVSMRLCRSGSFRVIWEAILCFLLQNCPFYEEKALYKEHSRVCAQAEFILYIQSIVLLPTVSTGNLPQ